MTTEESSKDYNMWPVIVLDEEEEESNSGDYDGGTSMLHSSSTRARFEDLSKKREFVERVRRMLGTFNRDSLDKFDVRLVYDESLASDIDGWMQNLVQNNVKDITLVLHIDGEKVYKLPEIMYWYESLTELSVVGCTIAPRTAIRWRFLTSLSIQGVELPQEVLMKLVWGCPVLAKLDLRRCWGFHHVKFNKVGLKELVIAQCGSRREGRSVMNLSVPFLHTLRVFISPERTQLRICDIQFLVAFYIDFDDFHCDDRMLTFLWQEIFSKAHNIEELGLGYMSFKIVTTMGLYAWTPPHSRRKGLSISVKLDFEGTLSGIISLLELSPYLDTLIIEGYGESNFALNLASLIGELKSDMRCLKTVSMTDLTDVNGEPMLSLARNLLKRSLCLDTIEIVTRNDTSKIKTTLLSYPTTSPIARLQILPSK